MRQRSNSLLAQLVVGFLICFVLVPCRISSSGETGDETTLGLVSIRFPGKRARYDFNFYYFDGRREHDDGSVEYSLLTGERLVITRLGRRFWFVNEHPIYAIVNEYFDDSVEPTFPQPRRHFTGFIEKYRREGLIRYLSPYEVPGLYDTQRRVPARAVPSGGQTAVSSGVSPGGGVVIIGGEHFPALISRWIDGRVVTRLEPEGEHSAVVAVAFSPDGRFILTTARGGTIRIWSTADGSLVRRCDTTAPLTCAAFTPDSVRVLAGDRSGAVRLWNISDDSEAVVIRDHESAVEALTVSPDGRRLVSGSQQGWVCVYDLGARPHLVRHWRAHNSSVTDLAFRPPHGQSFATASGTGAVRLWYREGGMLGEFNAHEGPVNTIAFAPDGQRLLSGGQDGRVQVGVIRGRNCLISGGFAAGRPVESISFHPDGRGYVICRRDEQPALRDLVHRDSRFGLLLADPVRERLYRHRSTADCNPESQ